MSGLWNWVSKKGYSDEEKVKIFLFLNCLKYSALGFVLWVIASRFGLDTYEWVLCFVGYPGFFIGYIGGNIFLYRK